MSVRKAFFMAAAAGLLFAGCATQSGRPIEEITRAQTLINQAGKSEAQRYAAAELDQARDKLKQAEDADRAGEHDVARYRATEAAADAELANARGASGQAQRAAEEVEQSIETLRQEASRQQSTTPPGQP